MRVLMLGWEFPPFIAGGLGTACYGLTRALDEAGHEVLFILPKPVDDSHAAHITLLSPAQLTPLRHTGDTQLPDAQPGLAARDPLNPDADDDDAPPAEPTSPDAPAPAGAPRTGFRKARFFGVPAGFTSPYPAFSDPASIEAWTAAISAAQRDPSRPLPPGALAADADEGWPDAPGPRHAHPQPDHQDLHLGAGVGYDGDMIGNTERYARLVLALARRQDFDVIHAHDWMTFPAGLALKRLARKPLVVHVHSTEFDRSGEHVNQRIYDIERAGMHGADRVIAVSMLTRSLCTARYAVPYDKIDVVYNGIDSDAAQPTPEDRIGSRDRIVLFLGRITMQKGPEYFIAAAKRVLEKVPDAKFIVAGSGDMAVRMIEYAAQLGIGHRVFFTGFLRGPQVDQIFQMADCYVMPSVSEPFGIAPLEALKNDTPVIISKQSGVSEVLTHALKVDFWDIDEMANKIVAVLRHPPLGETLREHAPFELRRLTWGGAAEKCLQAYEKVGVKRHP